MIETKKEALSCLREALSAELDDMLAASSFVRRSNSLNYLRKCESGRQLIRMDFAFKPKYQQGATGHIYPQITVELPQLNQVALEMVGGDAWLLAGASDATFSQPIDMAIPKEHHLRWFTFGPETFSECVSSIKLSLETWIIPFLDEYTTVNSITSAYENNDSRIVMQKHFFIYVAAAYVLLGKPESAMKVLEDKLGRAGSRRDYAQAFEYVGDMFAT